MTDFALTAPAGTATALATLSARTAEYVQAAKAPATVRAYRADWEHFETWCRAQALESLPATPQTVSLYLTAMAEILAAATLQRRIIAINKVHRSFSHPAPASMTNPLIGETVKGIHRVHGTAQDQKAPLLGDELRAVLARLPDTISGIRDRAILLIGFAGGFRRSELAGLNVEDLLFTKEGLVVTLRRSKTDQEGAGRQVAIPHGLGATCPVAAVKAWIKIAESGPLFRGIKHDVLGASLHADSIGQIVKRAVEAAGLNPERYAGHSLRAGLCTQAFANGAREIDIMRQTGHKSVTTLRRYVRDAALFRNNVGGMVGL